MGYCCARPHSVVSSVIQKTLELGNRKEVDGCKQSLLGNWKAEPGEMQTRGPPEEVSGRAITRLVTILDTVLVIL